MTNEERVKVVNDIDDILGDWTNSGDDFYLQQAIAAIRAAIEKEVNLPWKPRKGDVYYSFALLGDTWVVRPLWCGDFPNEYALIDKGWVYRTKEEAEAALPKVATEIGVKYEL